MDLLSLSVLLLIIGLVFSGFCVWFFVRNQNSFDLSKRDKNEDSPLHRALLYNVAHDVSNPLQNILFILEKMPRYEIEDKDRWKQDIVLIKTEISRLKRITDDAKLLAILEAPEVAEFSKEPVDIVPEIENVIILYSEMAHEKGIKIGYVGPQFAPIVFGSSAQLNEMLANLVENGIKFTNNELTVTLTTCNEEIKIFIADNGKGIPEHQIDKIWDVAYKFRDDETLKIKGSGLGLAIVKRIVERHGGVIDVKSDLQTGTTFRVTLPIYSPS